MKILAVLGSAVGILIVIILLYLIVVIFIPGFEVSRQPIAISQSTQNAIDDEPPAGRQSATFEVDGLSLSAWLYLPDDLSTPVPCIVMNTGFGGTKDMILESYALRFKEAGLAVLTYDYRYFGESEGEPRQLFATKYQLEDCRAAVRFARRRIEINPDKIAIWGTSAGGCYGLPIAAEDKKIACVCAQASGFDTKETGKIAVKREGLGSFLRLFMHAQRDKGRSRFGLSPHKIPIVGKPGTLAMITAPGAFEGYAKLVSKSFVNEVCARVLLTTGGFNPVDHAKDVQCPVLIQICEKDNIVPMSTVAEAIKILGECAEVKQYPIEHFDIYSGEYFEKSVSDQIEFFLKYL